jgi:hypothetical protein
LARVRRRAYDFTNKIFQADQGDVSHQHLPGGVMTTTPQIEPRAAGNSVTAPPGGTDADVKSAIDPVTLARLDYGLFLALRRMGTSRERICSALNLSYAEYDYINELD